MNFKIRVVENIGSWSKRLFGTPGTILVVTNGSFNDLDDFEWDYDDNPFSNIDEINEFFGEEDQWNTIFELVVEQEVAE